MDLIEISISSFPKAEIFLVKVVQMLGLMGNK